MFETSGPTLKLKLKRSACAAMDVKCRRLEGKVAIVTASTMGIGLAIAERLGLEGAAVVISSRKQVQLSRKTLSLILPSLLAVLALGFPLLLSLIGGFCGSIGVAGRCRRT